jgi:hypothetical protein
MKPSQAYQTRKKKFKYDPEYIWYGLLYEIQERLYGIKLFLQRRKK